MSIEDVLILVGEYGLAPVLGALAIWKWLIPFVKKLYQELLTLRKENAELREKLAYFKGKYTDKVVLKSHGKKRNLDD